jgi:hypothetical protein
MRVEQKVGERGSLMYLQRLVASRPDLLDGHLRTAEAIPRTATANWLSPRANDAWAEYRDADFLSLVGRPELIPKLRAFWPASGPQWDALGLAGNTLLLVEAKAHVGEMKSNCAAKVKRSREMIVAALDAASRGLGGGDSAKWMNGYYQLANRLAHLWFLRENAVDARLVLLQFTGHMTMPTSSTDSAYHAAFGRALQHLGFDRSVSLPGVVSVFQDVNEIL